MKDNKILNTLLKYNGSLIDAAEELGMTTSEALLKFHTDRGLRNKVKKANNIVNRYTFESGVVSKESIELSYLKEILNGNWQAIVRLLKSRGVNVPVEFDNDECKLKSVDITFNVETPEGIKDINVKFNEKG